MKFVRAVLVVLGTCGLALAAPAQTQVQVQAQPVPVQFGNLSLQWPGGYTVLRSADPVLLRGPRAQEVAASVYVALQEAPAEQRRFARRSAQLVRSAAASHGRVVRTREALLPDGSTLVAAASQARGAGRGYLLQFTVLAAAGHVGYVTVQGQGADAAAEFRRLLPAFQTVQWLPEAPGSTVVARD